MWCRCLIIPKMCVCVFSLSAVGPCVLTNRRAFREHLFIDFPYSFLRYPFALLFCTHAAEWLNLAFLDVFDVRCPFFVCLFLCDVSLFAP